jgi:colanic acid biosynthesis protein WcaH
MRIKAPFTPGLDCRAQSSPQLSPILPANAAPAAPLPKDVFATVVANAPLVAIDLIVQNAQGAVLLGLRTNPPAQGSWFVPGGRIRKDESLNAAFARIARDELGLQLQRNEHALYGVYEHFYNVNFNGTENASTHYVVLAYRLKIAPASLQLPQQQHSQYQWMQPDQITQHPDVHPYTKTYFELA